jgi:hypothetical protein
MNPSVGDSVSMRGCCPASAVTAPDPKERAPKPASQRKVFRAGRPGRERAASVLPGPHNPNAANVTLGERRFVRSRFAWSGPVWRLTVGNGLLTERSGGSRSPPKLEAMSPTPETRRPVRSSAEVNEQIRALWLRAGGSLSSEQRREYETLVTEWAEAMRREIVEAA